MGITVNTGGQPPRVEGLAITDVPEPDPMVERATQADPPPPSAGEGDRVVLFSINGIDYHIPKRPGPNVALRYLRDTRRHGREYALAGMMEAMVGRAGMDALADYEDLTDEELDSVMQAVHRHVLGPLERGKSGKL
jgi:hypothetical protein